MDIEDLKNYLRIDHTIDDSLLEMLKETAKAYILGTLEVTEIDDKRFEYAICLLVSHWYEFRRATSESALNDIPFGVIPLIQQLRGQNVSNFIKTYDLSERITFIEKKNDKDKLGGNIVIDTVVFTCWASVQSQFLNEVKSTIGTILEDTLTFIIRYQQVAAIKNTMKIEWSNETYEIVKINRGVARKDFTTIIAKAVS